MNELFELFVGLLEMDYGWHDGKSATEEEITEYLQNVDSYLNILDVEQVRKEYEAFRDGI